MGFWCFQNQAKNQRRTMSRTVRLRSSRGSTTSSTPPTRRSSSGRQFCAHMFPVPNERFVRFRSEFASKIESKPNGVSPRPSTVASVVAIGRWFWGMFYWPIRPRPFFVESDWIWPSMRTGLMCVLIGYTGSYRVLLGYNGFYWDLLGFTGFYHVWLFFTGFYCVLLGYTGFC